MDKIPTAKELVNARALVEIETRFANRDEQQDAFIVLGNLLHEHWLGGGWDRHTLLIGILVGLKIAENRTNALEEAVKDVLWQKGDDLCWMDIYTLTALALSTA